MIALLARVIILSGFSQNNQVLTSAPFFSILFLPNLGEFEVKSAEPSSSARMA